MFGEDLAAQLGLIFALSAITLTMVTGNPIYDAIGSIGIGVLLVMIAILIGREVKDLLVGQGVDPLIDQQMRQWLTQHQDVIQLYNLLTLQLGPDVMVAVKVQMSNELSGPQMIAQINAIEAEFKQQYPQVVWLFFEPDCDN